MWRRTGLAAAVLALMTAACAPPVADPTTTDPTTTAAIGPVTSTPVTTPVPVATTAAPSPAVPATTTTTTTMPTATTLPPLDRSAAATADRMRHDLGFLLAVGPRPSGSSAEAMAAHWFAGQAATITGRPARIEEFPLPGRDPSRNVWAPEVGSGERLLVVGAHLDTWAGSPGADDNGSGVIIVLELLRRLAEDPPVGLRVLVIGFGAEEWVEDHDHHIGSKAVAAGMASEGALPDWMISVDMAGLGPRLQSVDFDGADPSLADLIASVGTAAGLQVDRLTRGEISDHDSFARLGVPAALLMRSGNPDYHTPAEVNVRDEALLETLEVVELVVARLAAGGA